MNNLGERLYELRTKNEMSQGALAEKLDVSRQTISKWENNISIPELDKIVSLSNLFGVSVDYIVKGEDGETPVISEVGYEVSGSSVPVRMIRVNPTDKYIYGLSIAFGIIKLIMVFCNAVMSMRSLSVLEGSNYTTLMVNFIASAIVNMFIGVALLSRRKNVLSAALITQAVYTVISWLLPTSSEGERALLWGISSVLMTAIVLLFACSSVLSKKKNAKVLFAITVALLFIQFAVNGAAYAYSYVVFAELTLRNVVVSVFNTMLQSLPGLFVNIGIAIVIYLRANPKPAYEVAENQYPGYDEMYVGIVWHILLSIFTLGIYNCIWTYKITECLNGGRNEIQSGAKKLLLCIFVPFYRIYWYYNQSKRLEGLMKDKDENTSEFAIVTLILAIFVPVVAASAFLQVKINEYAKKES